MEATKTENYEDVLKTVRAWPAPARFMLVQEVLETLSAQTDAPRPRRRTLDRALGLLATDHPAPSDAVIQEWLDEHRREKYG